MKKYLRIIAVALAVVAGLSSCSTKTDPDEPNPGPDKEGRIATVQQQTDGIKASLKDLEKVESDLSSCLSSIPGSTPNLRAGLESEAGILKDKVKQLQSYATEGIAARKDWYDSTIGTIEQYKDVTFQLELIRQMLGGAGDISSAKTLIQSIDAAEKSMEGWVSTSLTGYQLVAGVAARAGYLKDFIGNVAAEYASEIDDIVLKIKNADSDLEKAYESAIKSVITNDKGVIKDTQADAIKKASDKHKKIIDALSSRLGNVEKSINEMDKFFADILSKIQTFKFVSRYQDGTVLIDKAIKSVDMDFEVDPADLAESLAGFAEKSMVVEVACSEDGSGSEILVLPVSSASCSNGKLNVKADGATLPDAFWSGSQAMYARLFAGCGDNTLMSKYARMEPAQYALDTYWDENYNGKLGFQLGTMPQTGDAGFVIAGKPIYVTGVNCFNLFALSYVAAGMSTTNMENSVKAMAKEQVPVVRFNCSPFYANQVTYYVDNRSRYLEVLDYLGKLCDEAHILMIPSLFWSWNCMPEYYSEPKTAWGDPSSKTYKFMVQYTTDIVNTLKKHKSLAAFEFGNEFNLQSDLGGIVYGQEQMPATCINTAFKAFAQLCHELDPDGRIVTSGHSYMRDMQWHLYNNRSLETDTYKQYVEITGFMTPSPMEGMSEHIYDDGRTFSDLGKCDLSQQLKYAKQCAAELGKAFYVGEFTGPGATATAERMALVKSHYDAHFDAGVQLSLVWNFRASGNVEGSFSTNTTECDTVMGYMREQNEKFKVLSYGK